MSKGRFELNIKGLQEIMKSAEMQNYIENIASEVEASANNMADDPLSKYGHKVKVLDYVAVGKIYPTNAQAARDNYNNNTLLKAMGATGLPTHK